MDMPATNASNFMGLGLSLCALGLVSSQGKNINGTTDFVDVGVDLSNRSCVIFQLQSCDAEGNSSRASIALTARQNDYTNDYYQIVLNQDTYEGGPHNFILKNGVNYPQAAWLSQQESIPVSCTEETFFWISWRDGSITLGSGNSPATNSVLVFHDDSPTPINFMSVSNYDNASQSCWSIPAEFYSADTTSCTFPETINGSAEKCDQPDRDIIATASAVFPGMNLRLRSWIVFQVMATSDVEIAFVSNYFNGDPGISPFFDLSYLLSRDHTQKYLYNYIFTETNKYAQSLVTNATLNPTEFETFWVSWSDGNVMSGKGDQVGRNVYMAYHSPSMSSTDNIWNILFGSKSETEAVMRFSGCYFPYDMNVTINDSLIHDVQVDLSVRECIMFQLKSCSDDGSIPGTAQIYLTARMNDFNNDVYIINMDGSASSYCVSIIKNGAHLSNLIDCSGFLLSCSELNWYWVSWRSGSIMVGMGQQPGVNSMLTFYDDSPVTILYMAVSDDNSTGVSSVVSINLPAVLYSQNTTYCNFPDSIDGSAESCVEKDKEYTFSSTTNLTEIDVSKRSWIVYQVQATSDIYVSLLSERYKGDTDNNPQYAFTYDESISGAEYHTIRKNQNYAVAELSSGSILNPSAQEWFWISWDKGTVMSGKGEMVGENVLLSFHDASPESTDNISLVQIGCASATSCMFAPAIMSFSGCYFITAGCSPLVNRSEWKSKTVTPSSALLTLPVKKIIVHVTQNDECYTPTQCLKQVKDIESYQQQQHYTKLDEIAYNYLIGEDGRVYEGTGQHVGNHTKGHNDDSYGIAFIGKFKSRLPIERALKAFQQLLSTICVTDLGLDANYTIAPHYNVDCTLCPNGPLRKWIEKEYQGNYQASSFTCRRGGYAHAVKK